MIEPEDKPKENPEDESQDSQNLFTIRLHQNFLSDLTFAEGKY